MKTVLAIASLLLLTPSAFASPISDIEQQNAAFMDLVRSTAGDVITNQVDRQLLINEGMRTCLRLHQGWSNTNIWKNQAERIIELASTDAEMETATSLFASVNVAAKEHFCPGFN